VKFTEAGAALFDWTGLLSRTVRQFARDVLAIGRIMDLKKSCLSGLRANPLHCSHPRHQNTTPSAKTVNSTMRPAMVMERKKRSILRKCPYLMAPFERSKIHGRRMCVARDAGSMEKLMINNHPAVKDPYFWITMAIGFSPILLASVILFWFV
jgi:hypothetical protein